MTYLLKSVTSLLSPTQYRPISRGLGKFHVHTVFTLPVAFSMSVEPVIGSRSFDQKSTLGAEADTQTGSPTAKADSLAPSTLSTLVEVNEPSTTVWEGFFTQKKEEFARAISKLEKSRTENNWKALKDRLTPKLDAKADEQAMTIDDALGRVKTLDSFKREVLAFVERFSVKEGESRNWFKKQTDRLFRGAQKVNQFQAGISCAVQMDPMGSACLIWGLILIVIQVCHSESTHLC